MQRKREILLVTMTCLLVAGQLWAGNFVVTSPQLETGGTLQIEQVFDGFGCTGKNISPELKWFGEPEQTKSFAVTVYDPDAPTGSGWWHWLVFNIPASTHALAEGSGNIQQGVMPAGVVQSRTDFGKAGYGGACPPAGDKAHRYQFTVWALDVDELPVDQSVSGAMVGFFLNQHQLAQATLTVTYGR